MGLRSVNHLINCVDLAEKMGQGSVDASQPKIQETRPKEEDVIIILVMI